MGLGPKSQPPSALPRPPVTTGPSSSASLLYGMEQAVPSFQSFLKRTPPVNQHKPLPPTPRKLRRTASFDSATSSRPSSIFVRSQRSRSVHSHTMNQQDREPCIPPHSPAFPSRQLSDSTDRLHVPLRPIAYSASTSQLVPMQTYSPVVVDTPSPRVSKRTTPSPDPEPRPSILLPSAPTGADIPQHPLRTVSLEKAKQVIHAPGAVHLLPEELCAQGLRRSCSQEPLHITPRDAFAAGISSLDLPRAPRLVDSQGRERLVAAATSTFTGSPCLTTTRSRKAPLTMPELESQPVKTTASVAPQTYEESGNKAAKVLGLEGADASRSRERARDLPYEYLPKTNRTSDASNSPHILQSDAHRITQEYHAIISEHHRQPSTSLTLDASENPESAGEVTIQMQMVPQPLFHKSPTAQVPDIVSMGVLDRGSSFISPEHAHADRDVIEGLDGQPISRTSSVPLERSRDARAAHRHQKTTGSISPCPPSITIPRKTMAVLRPGPNEQTAKSIPKGKRNDGDNRISHFYPHVMPRRAKGNGQRDKGKGKSRKHSAPSHNALSPPTAAIDNTAERSRTPDGDPDASLLRDNAAQNAVRSYHNTDRGSAQLRGNSDKLLHEQRFDKLEPRRAALVCEPRKENSAMEGRVSPKLQPVLSRASSANSDATVHLGCSDLVKGTFSKVLSIVPPLKIHTVPTTNHTISPARRSEARTPAPGGSDGLAMKPSLCGAFTTSWRDSKAERKRQNLKKLIKIVHSERQEEEQTGAVQVARRLSLSQRI